MLSKYLKKLTIDDLLYCALGGILGSFLAFHLGAIDWYEVAAFSLIGMIISSFIIARKRLKGEEVKR